MLDYENEAATYDATRGGVPRAEAAAGAVLGLVPPAARTLLDIGCGTGLVTERIAAGRPRLRVFGSDAAHGMARVAGQRVGGVVLADARRLPLPDAAVDAVTAVWLLHLLREEGAARAVVAQAARVLRPGGVFVTTVDKDAAHDVGSDIDEAFAPYLAPSPSDMTERIIEYGAAHGLDVAGSAVFRGHGQGWTPLNAARGVRRGYFVSRLALSGTNAEQLAQVLTALPGPEHRRADPEYRLLAFRRR
ncbi:class I SAM-dependent methyltransferase [Streptomyces sp. NBC_01022]|uniref:class I SAM-dependent methyltransferase n=1 Tax=Streptomyces sp. NBC_01022 TaxID=2903723 RepID=UPI002DDB09DB|nr:methyltransferase domain-containing protein [Streptomyces sp. NBC_01022]WRZ85781.1 methyltransferase domain-containing protein [Streptomyces sp. NBC_01022]